MSEIYCKDCKLWKPRPGQYIYKQCNYEVDINPKHPVEPQIEYGDFKVMNKDNNCSQFDERQKENG